MREILTHLRDRGRISEMMYFSADKNCLSKLEAQFQIELSVQFLNKHTHTALLISRFHE